MGLDMYLNARRYYYHADEAPNVDGVPDAYRVQAVEVEAAYWRKANHIHKWFVDNVQDGTDDCGVYDVSRNDLNVLVDLCKQVLADKSKAEELLPTASGFFFGSTEYDEGYFNDLESTIKQIEKALSILPEWHFQYQSSW